MELFLPSSFLEFCLQKGYQRLGKTSAKSCEKDRGVWGGTKIQS